MGRLPPLLTGLSPTLLGHASWTTGWMVLVSMGWRTYLYEECQAYLQESFRMGQLKNSMDSKDFHRLPEPRWETDLDTRCTVAREIALGIVMPFSQRVCIGCIPNMLSSWVRPHTQKVTTKTATLVLMAWQQQGTKDSNILWASKYWV